MSHACFVAIPLSVMGLSAVCDCDISQSYPLTILGCHSCEQRWLSAHLLGLVWAIAPVQNSYVVAQMAIECQFVRAAKALASLHICTAYLSHRHCTKFLVLPKMAICVPFTPAANTLVSLHICAGKFTRQCDKYLLCWQRRLLGVCTFAQARLSLRHSIEISCAGWNGDFCNVYVNSECCGESALATTSLLCNHQCVVSMRQKCSQCVVIKFLNKTFTSFPRKKSTKW